MNVLGTQLVGFTCFFTSKARKSQHAAADAQGMNVLGAQFTCFTGKKNTNTDVLHCDTDAAAEEEQGGEEIEVLRLLALLVPKYKY